jgi:hypothetical protein
MWENSYKIGGKKMKRHKIFSLVFVFALLIVPSFNPVEASTTSEVQSQVSTFLVQVAGLDEDNFTFSDFGFNTNNFIESNTSYLSINSDVTNNNQSFILSMRIVDEKVVSYSFRLRENNNADNATISREESSNVAERFLRDYKTLFDAAYLDEPVEALSSLSTQDSVVEYENARLKVDYADVSDAGTKYASYRWVKTIDGVEVPMSVRLTVDKNGQVTKFRNSLELYTIVTADVLISEEQAMAIGQQYIDEYVEENDVKVVEIGAKFGYTRDQRCHRGDSYTIYPQWVISANFSEMSEQGVFGYSVLIWADTGEAYHYGVQGVLSTSNTESSTSSLLPASSTLPAESSTSSLLPLITGIALAFALTIIAIYLVKKKPLTKHKKEETL